MMMNIKRRLIQLERLVLPTGLLPMVVAEDALAADIDRLRRQGWEVIRLTDFLDQCT
jgi:hypothetical protein